VPLLTELLDGWFRQLLALLLLPGLLGALLHVTERGTQAWLRRLIGWRGVVWWTGWLGTPVHELSHALVSLAFGHRIHEVKLFEPHPEDGVLGYVRYSIRERPAWLKWYGTVGTFFSGVAPLFGGSLVLVLALRLLAPGAEGVFAAAERYATSLGAAQAGSPITGFVALVRAVYASVFADGLATVRPWLFLYVALAVGAHLAPSPADLKGGARGFLVLVSLLLVFDATLLVAGGSPRAAIGPFAHLASLLSAVLCVALVLNVGNLGVAFAAGALAGRRRDA
jgi:hypothetical protein